MKITSPIGIIMSYLRLIIVKLIFLQDMRASSLNAFTGLYSGFLLENIELSS